MKTLELVIICLVAIFGAVPWFLIIRATVRERRSTEVTAKRERDAYFGGRVEIFPAKQPPMSSGRITNILLSAILGLLIGWMVVTGLVGCSIDTDDGSSPPPEPRCDGLTLSSCLSRVNITDGGVND